MLSTDAINNFLRDLVEALGQNYTLKDKKLVISLNEWLKPIISQYPVIEKEYNRQEPRKGVAIKRQKEVFASLSPIMRGLVDDVRTEIMKNSLLNTSKFFL